MFFKKHKDTIILGLLILIVFICALIIFRSPWLDKVHAKYLSDSFTNITGSMGNPTINLTDIRYPDGEDYIQLAFNESIKDKLLEFKSTATGRVYQASEKDMQDSGKIARIYIDPGEYVMTLRTKNSSVPTSSDRVIINPVFNFKGSGNQFYRLPVSDPASSWTNSENMLLGIAEFIEAAPIPSTDKYKYQLDTSSSPIDLGPVNMHQFNNVQFIVKLPSLADYKGKLLEIGFVYDIEENAYRKKIQQLDSYYPTEFISSVEVVGRQPDNTGPILPADKKPFPSPKLLFSKSPLISSPTTSVTVKNVRTNYVYKMTLILKYRRPESTGYRTSLPLSIKFKVTDATGNNDLTLAGANTNPFSQQIVTNAKRQLKFESEQVNQDSRIAQLESEQNKLFETVGSM